MDHRDRFETDYFLMYLLIILINRKHINYSVLLNFTYNRMILMVVGMILMVGRIKIYIIFFHPMKIEAIEYNLELKKLNGIELDPAYLDIL